MEDESCFKNQKEEVEKDISNCISKIFTNRNKILENTKKVEVLKQTVEKKATDYQLEIAHAEDSKGKKLYSNEQMRKAAVIKYMQEDKDIPPIQQEVNNIQYENQELTVNIEYYQNKLKGYQIISKMFYSE